MKIMTYREAVSFFASFIPKKAQLYAGQFGLDRARFLLGQLGNPQDRIPVLHVAGTSGKGSTSFYISRILHAHGLRTGLHVSPHLLDVRERFQINGTLIPVPDMLRYLDMIIPAIERTSVSHFGKPTYFEVLIALAFTVFSGHKVGAAVIETGMGGLHDGTNTISSPDKISVLTRIGLDHTQILGKTIGAIARQKSGIILPRSFVVVSPQTKEAESVIGQIAKKRMARIEWAPVSKPLPASPGFCRFSYRDSNLSVPDITLPTPARYQAENATLAIASCIRFARQTNLSLSPSVIQKTLSSSRFAGRMDIFRKGAKTVIVDGAHNPQKMTAFMTSLSLFAPGKRHIFVVAFKEGKDTTPMVRRIIPHAKKIIFTSFFLTNQDVQNMSEKPTALSEIARQTGFSSFAIIPDTNKAFAAAFSEGDSVVVTGSLYLAGELYPAISRWSDSTS